jgi:hypothetical protein
VEECCNVPNSREFVGMAKKSEKICNAHPVDFGIFNSYKLNKYQSRSYNEIYLSDPRLQREMAKDAVRSPSLIFMKK